VLAWRRWRASACSDRVEFCGAAMPAAAPTAAVAARLAIQAWPSPPGTRLKSRRTIAAQAGIRRRQALCYGELWSSVALIQRLVASPGHRGKRWPGRTLYARRAALRQARFARHRMTLKPRCPSASSIRSSTRPPFTGTIRCRWITSWGGGGSYFCASARLIVKHFSDIARPDRWVGAAAQDGAAAHGARLDRDHHGRIRPSIPARR
jgi:hypothetical protein